MVDRVKPWFMVQFMVQFVVQFMVQFIVWFMVPTDHLGWLGTFWWPSGVLGASTWTMYTSHYHSGSFNVSFRMFFLNMVQYPVFSFCCPPWLWTPLWHTGVLGASISFTLKSYGWLGGVVGWLIHKILVSAPVPFWNGLVSGFDWVGAGLGLVTGLTIMLIF